MLSHVLGRLEALQSDLAAIDPTREVDAADRVAAMAVALRDVLGLGGRTADASEGADAARMTIANL